MSGAITVSCDGGWITLALEDENGDQAVWLAPRSTLLGVEYFVMLETWSGGDALNVLASPTAVGQAFYHGQMGEFYRAVLNDNATLEDATFAAETSNAAVYSNSSSRRLLATAWDSIYRSLDQTNTWELVGAAAGNITAMAAAWRGEEVAALFVASRPDLMAVLEYMTSWGVFDDITGSDGLEEAAGICSLELVK